MGLWISKLINVFADFAESGKDARILMIGLDAAGKTTILYKCKLNETISTIPTIGFNVESVSPCTGVNFTVWDVGGQDKIRPLWRHYYENTQGLMYVVDSSDPERLSESRAELEGVLSDDAMRNVPVVVVANKQDMPNALSPSQVVDQLHLRNLGRTHPWHVQGACATNGDGILEAMQAMSRLVKESLRKD